MGLDESYALFDVFLFFNQINPDWQMVILNSQGIAQIGLLIYLLGIQNHLSLIESVLCV